ncbi:hypothetical protein HK101_003350 [Irineochytrium annulatum]|nr:hypothetical protein HK101_003350 [Irineochytrium annulatum]
MRLSVILASSLLGLSFVSALPHHQAHALASGSMHFTHPNNAASYEPQASASQEEDRQPDDALESSESPDDDADASSYSEPGGHASAAAAEPEGDDADEADEPDEDDASPAQAGEPEDEEAEHPEDSGDASPGAEPEDEEAEHPEDSGDAAQGAEPEDDEGSEAQSPEDDEGDAQDAPDEGETASAVPRRLSRRSVEPSEDAAVAGTDKSPSTVSTAGSHHGHHHHRHNRFHYRKSLRSRRRHRTILRNRVRNFKLSGKKVNYGSTYYRKANLQPVAAANGKGTTLAPAGDTTYKKSYYAGVKGTLGRQGVDRVRYFSDYRRRHRHMKVRHE